MSAAPRLAWPCARPARQQRHVVDAELIADQAVGALLRELAAWPKPGLVSHVDSGSHADMDAALLQASAETLRPFFAELASAGQGEADRHGWPIKNERGKQVENAELISS